MMGRIFLAVVLLFFAGCSSAPVPDPRDPVRTEAYQIVILGGTPYALALAAGLKEYDESLNLLIVTEQTDFVCEPFIGLYLIDKIDGKLVSESYESIAKKHGYRVLKGTAATEAGQEFRINNRIIRADRIVDARFTSGAEWLNMEKIDALKARLAARESGAVLLRGSSALPVHYRDRIMEMGTLIRSVYTGKKIALDMEGGADAEGFDLVIDFPHPPRDGSPGVLDSYFAQFNTGLEHAAEIIREDFNGSYLPSLVNEESMMITDPLLIRGKISGSSEIIDASGYLAKIYRINRFIK